MRQRRPEEWMDWLARDRTFSPQPYAQLGAVLLGAGRRDTTEAIRFAGHERERDQTWAQAGVGSWRWLGHDLLGWIWLTLFSGLAGYGIGLYTFRVLLWVALLAVLGAGVASVWAGSATTYAQRDTYRPGARLAAVRAAIAAIAARPDAYR
jgi:hypothetical protein